jgi:magnesium transporter
VGAPLQEGLLLVHNTLVGLNLRERVKIGCAGKIISAFDIARAMALGADWCNSARGFMFAVGCIQAQTCHTGNCPTGVSTQDPQRQQALVVPTKAERVFVGSHFGVELPDPIEATDLEVSARFHVEENDDIHLHSNFLFDRDGNSKSVPVAFILHGGILFSLRNEELSVFRLQRRRALTQPGYVTDCVDLLLDLYGADVEVSADSLENIYAKLGVVGRHVLSEAITDQQAAGILADIAEEEDQNGRIRSNILDTQRALSFLMRGRLLTPDQISDSKQILRNIDSLNSHTAFLFDKINFLMDATIGFININQNKRVNQLTVFSVVFMPINILAGVGGMSEFSMMTEGTPWPLAYGGFLLGSALIGLVTYVLLKHFEKKRLKKTI